MNMSDWASLIQNGVSGLLTGGAGAASTMLAVFKDTKRRLEVLEKTLGSPGSTLEPRTGMHLLVGHLSDAVERLTDEVKKLRRGFDNMEDDPPEWFTRAMNRRASESDHSLDLERIEKLVKSAIDRAKRAEEEVEQMREDFRRNSGYVDQASYDRDTAKRAEEFRKIQETLSSVNGFLRGVMAALGYIDATTQEPLVQPVAPPSPPPRRK